MSRKKTENMKQLHKTVRNMAGSLHLGWKRCGRQNCHCARGEVLHGPYVAHHWRENGVQKKRYVPMTDLAEVLSAIQEQNRFSGTLCLRDLYLAGIEHPTAADHMLADSAIMAYRNMLRVQGWLGSLCLEVERQLFGQSASATDADELAAMMEKMEVKLLPMLERCQRMLCRALDRLEARREGKPVAIVSIGKAGLVNAGSTVRNGVG